MEHHQDIAAAEAALRQAGVAPNTLRAYRSDLAYWRVWHRTCFATDLPMPTPEDTVVAYITDHAGAMRPEVEEALMMAGVKTAPGAHRYSTIRRRLAGLGSAHIEAGYPDPTTNARVRSLLRRARAAARDQPRRAKRALLLSDVQAMAATCDDTRHGLRDRALLLTLFLGGGRRRSEAGALLVEHVRVVPNGYLLRLNAAKTTPDPVQFPVLGEGAQALHAWLAEMGCASGPLFPRIYASGCLGPALSPAAVNSIVKKRAALAGLDPRTVSAHGLRRGFVTECGRRGICLGDAMAVSRHASLGVVLQHYYDAGQLLANPAAHVGATAPQSRMQSRGSPHGGR